MLNIANNWISKLSPINKFSLKKKKTKIDQIHFKNPYNAQSWSSKLSPSNEIKTSL